MKERFIEKWNSVPEEAKNEYGIPLVVKDNNLDGYRYIVEKCTNPQGYELYQYMIILTKSDLAFNYYKRNGLNILHDKFKEINVYESPEKDDDWNIYFIRIIKDDNEIWNDWCDEDPIGGIQEIVKWLNLHNK